MTDIQPEREALTKQLEDAGLLGHDLEIATDFILADRQAQRSRICGEIKARLKPFPDGGDFTEIANDTLRLCRKVVEGVEHGTQN